MNHQLENAVPHQAVVQGGRAAAPLKPGPGLREERAGVSETSGTTAGLFRKKGRREKINAMNGWGHSQHHLNNKKTVTVWFLQITALLQETPPEWNL